MGNCLVTKLNSVVDNNNLEKLGVIRIRFEVMDGTPDPFSQLGLVISSTEPYSVRIIGDGYFTHDYLTPSSYINQYEEVTRLDDYGFFFTNGTYDVEISNKYALKYVNRIGDINKVTAWGADISTYNYGINLVSVNLYNTKSYGDIKNLEHSPLITNVSCINTNVYGDIKSLENKSRLNVVMLPKDVYGDLSVFKQKQELLNVTIWSPNITGNLSDITSNSITTIFFASSKINGNILDIQNYPSLSSITLTLSKTFVGDISGLASIQSLQSIYLQHTAISGNINTLNPLINLKQINMSYTNVTGNKSQLLEAIPGITVAAFDGTAVVQ